MSNFYSDKLYNGPEAIVVAMDIGTTQSAVSFAHFVPGTHTQVQTVTQWPGHVNSSAAKTPSMVTYRDGKLEACGAKAIPEFERHQNNVAYWFKLHLHPATMSQLEPSDFEIPPLPAGVTIERVYADIMKYLMEHMQHFFGTTTKNGEEIWTRVRDSIIIVLAIPNGWGIREQATLRKAAVRASLVTEENAGQLLQFVTEAEASVHYLLASPDQGWLRRSDIFAVIDCGGSTVDTTIYRCISTNPLSLKETCPGECIQAGGVFVDREAKKMLEKKLKGSSFSNQQTVQEIVNAFERQVKPEFSGTMDRHRFKFGVDDDNNPSLGIRKGYMTLSDKDLKPVFNPIIDKIVTSCSSLIVTQRVEYVLLVGGFGECLYLRRVLSQKIPSDIPIIGAGEALGKAAAEGAAIYHIKQFVIARATKATFGGCVRLRYDKKLHRDRSHIVQIYPDGTQRVDGAFHVWIKKGTVVQGTFAHKLSYHVAWDATSMSKNDLALRLGTVEIEVFAWERDGAQMWCKDANGAVLEGMRLICTLSANLSALAGGLQIKNGSRGKRFYRVDYNVLVYFGGTQLRAKLQWKEGRLLREGPVSVMPYVS